MAAFGTNMKKSTTIFFICYLLFLFCFAESKKCFVMFGSLQLRLKWHTVIVTDDILTTWKKKMEPFFFLF